MCAVCVKEKNRTRKRERKKKPRATIPRFFLKPNEQQALTITATIRVLFTPQTQPIGFLFPDEKLEVRTPAPSACFLENPHTRGCFPSQPPLPLPPSAVVTNQMQPSLRLPLDPAKLLASPFCQEPPAPTPPFSVYPTTTPPSPTSEIPATLCALRLPCLTCRRNQEPETHCSRKCCAFRLRDNLHQQPSALREPEARSLDLRLPPSLFVRVS